MNPQSAFTGIVDESNHELFRSLPRWEQFNGVWSLRDQDAQALLAHVQQMNLHLHVSQQREAQLEQMAARQREPRYANEASVAIIAVHGTLTKRGSSMTAGLLDHRQALRQAAKDPDVSAILLHFDSPGGNMAGLEDFAGDILTARQQKPVWGYAEDLCCSAAYYLASQTLKLYANSTAVIGSIGVFTVVPDFSALYAREGIKLHKFVAGQPYKGAGVMGTELSAEQAEELQRQIEEANGYFLTALQRGRGFSTERVRELNTGAVWIGQKAVKERLVDGIDSLDNVLAALSRSVSSSDRKAGRSQQSAEMPSGASGDRTMQATIETLKAALPGATKEFLFDCVEAGHTVEKATATWLAQLEKQLSAQVEANQQLTAQVKALESEVAQLKAAPPAAANGIDESNTKTSAKAPAGDTHRAQWQALVAECVQECGGDKAKGTALAARRNPELREQMLEEVNRPTK